MTVTTHTISDTQRTRTVRGEAGILVLREERRTLPGGRAWCIVSCAVIDARRASAVWPA